MGRFPSSSYHRTPWAAFPREAPSPAEPGQGARHSPAGWHRQANVPALGGDPGAAVCPSHTQLNWESWGAVTCLPVPLGFSSALGPSKLSVCSANNLQQPEETPYSSAEAPGETSCFPLIRGEQTGGCRHHGHKLRQGSGSLPEKLEGGCSAQSGWHHSSQANQACRVAAAVDEKEKLRASEELCAPWAKFSTARSPARARRLAVRAALLQEPRDGGSQRWMPLVQGGWVQFPACTEGTCLQEKGS